MTDGPVFSFDSAGDVKEVISDEEAERLAAERKAADGVNEPEPVYAVEALSGRFRLDHSDAAPRRGDVIRPGHPSRINPFGEAMSAYCDALPSSGEAAELQVRRVGFDLFFEPPVQVYSATEGNTDDVPAASDGYDSVAVDRDTNVQGDITQTLHPPNRAENLTVHVVPSGACELTVTFVGPGGLTTTRSKEDNSDYESTGGEDIFVRAPLPVIEEVRLTVTDNSAAENNTVLNATVT